MLNAEKGTIIYHIYSNLRPEILFIPQSYHGLRVSQQALHSAMSNQVSHVRQCVYGVA